VTPFTHIESSPALEGYVWLVLRAKSSPFQDTVVEELKRWTAANSGVTLRVFRAQERRLTKDGGGRRPIDVLNPVDAHELYQKVHRVRSCVLGQGSLYVLKDPRKDPPSGRDCFTLAEYLCHKVSYEVLQGETSPSAAAAQMLLTPPSDCSGTRDPRILPLHVFNSQIPSTGLLDSAGRERFRQSYEVKGGGWASPSAGCWKQADAHARHGAAGPDREPLRVGRYDLPLGFHWDADAGRHTVTVANSAVAWKVDPNGYVNVYPDAYIRSGSRGSHKVWSAER